MIKKCHACLGEREDAVELKNKYIGQLEENMQLNKDMAAMERSITKQFEMTETLENTIISKH
jgi:hypothetical protein